MNVVEAVLNSPTRAATLTYENGETAFIQWREKTDDLIVIVCDGRGIKHLDTISQNYHAAEFVANAIFGYNLNESVNAWTPALHDGSCEILFRQLSANPYKCAEQDDLMNVIETGYSIAYVKGYVKKACKRADKQFDQYAGYVEKMVKADAKYDSIQEMRNQRLVASVSADNWAILSATVQEF